MDSVSAEVTATLRSESDEESEDEFVAQVNIQHHRLQPHREFVSIGPLLHESVVKNRLDRVRLLTKYYKDHLRSFHAWRVIVSLERSLREALITARTDRAIIRALCEAAWAYDDTIMEGRTGLFLTKLAILYNRLDALEEMKRWGADISVLPGPFQELIVGKVECGCDNGLMHAAFHGNVAAVCEKLSCLLSEKEQDHNGDRATASHNDMVMMKLKKTALKYAAWRGHSDVVNVLLAAGVPAEFRDEEINSPLVYAVCGGHVETARCLLQAGANANQFLRKSGKSLLEIAVAKKSTDLLRLLLDFRAFPNVASKDGQTALMEAAFQGRDGIVALDILLSSGAKVNQRKPGGETALFLACCVGNCHATKKLVLAGADVNGSKEESDITPLMVALSRGKVRCTRQLLLSNQLNIDRTGSHGRTGLHQCCKGNNIKGALMLLQAGIDKRKVDNSNRTATQLLVRYFDSECQELGQIIESFQPSLTDLCLRIIRQSLHTSITADIVCSLPLPVSMRKKVLFL